MVIIPKMTNRNYIRPYSAGMAIKKPRLRRIEIGMDGPPPPTPEGISNGMRPHGGYKGMKQHPPGQFSFDKDESYASEIRDEYQLLLTQENKENHGAPYWVSDVQREITHSGESPLFTNKLLASGKIAGLVGSEFEQEHGVVSMERALLSTKPRRLMSAPRRRHLNGVKEYYRPNSTHQYLSATDLRNLDDNEEIMVKYGRPTRTTLLRARQRSNSAINAYDLRRQANKRMEEVRNNTIFYTAKEYINIYQADGETMHSFLTGARYNRAHLLDSKGLSVYGVYMPRENPTECFITRNRRMKDVGEDIPSAPPDSPRSDIEDNIPSHHSRPSSSTRQSVTSRATSSRPGSSRPMSKTTSSRPPSNRKGTPLTIVSRPRSAKEPGSASTLLSQTSRPHPPRSADNSRRELPLPDEVTMVMPDHVNKGKAGVYVTLKGQKIIESVESKLPRVTGVSLPKIRNKSRDFMDEVQVVNQPPPTPVEPSVISIDRNRQDGDIEEDRNRLTINDRGIETETKEVVVTHAEELKESNNEQIEKAEKGETLGEVLVKENPIDERKSMEIRPAKHVNFTGISEDSLVESGADIKESVRTGVEIADDIKNNDTTEVKAEGESVNTNKGVSENESVGQEITEKVKDDNVVFFMTEDGNKEGQEEGETDENENADNKGKVKPAEIGEVDTNDNASENVDMDEAYSARDVGDVIKVEISEADKSTDRTDTVEETQNPITVNDYPFTQASE